MSFFSGSPQARTPFHLSFPLFVVYRRVQVSIVDPASQLYTGTAVSIVNFCCHSSSSL